MVEDISDAHLFSLGVADHAKITTIGVGKQRARTGRILHTNQNANWKNIRVHWHIVMKSR